MEKITKSMNYIYNYVMMFPSILTTLIIFMIIEIVTFLLLCLVFENKLTKTDLYKNITKKIVMILLIIMVYRIDLLLTTPFLSSIYIAFISNEIILIVENITLMGLPVPRVIINIVSILKNREKEIEEKEPLGNQKSQE